MPLTRRRLVGVALALALAGALSAGVASSVERARGRVRKRPEPPPPFSQRNKAREESALACGTRPEATKPPAVDGAVVAEVSAPDLSSETGGGRVTEVEARPVAGGAPGEVASHETAARPEAPGPPGHEGPVPGLTTRIPAPMHVGWTVVESSAGRVRLVAEVERRLGFGAPVEVRLSLPREASLLEGPARFTVPEGPGGDVRAVSYVVAFEAGALPSGDLVLVAHAEGASFGAHAEARYSFGREPTAEPRPMPSGPVLPGALMLGEEPGTQGSEGGGTAP
ncbi:hypothetical protein [Myxococcus sp. RHSTA-1-4]|uniref:hypothetical protein n=1 Tax=Myxococcus sp. RHSTA-1-4 TaxID=2874601 RepID=UPI001CBBEDC6|nr:hypothetical protein [Myxococcus sp. RHSTA-1-4]MBZ4414986.1 hypothetical protein [Myxococcus sp. RHSTA-1-4]